MRRLVTLMLLGGALAWLAPICIAGGSYKEERLLLKRGSLGIEAISASTLVHGASADRYSIRNLFDGNKATAWVTKFDRRANYRNGGLFRISLRVPVYVKSITISNGCQATERLFRENQRIKSLSIEKVLIGGRSFPLENTVSLKDELGSQVISLRLGWTQSINLFRTKDLIFNVLDIYEGSKYDDLCISDVTLSYSDEIEYSPSVSWKDLREMIDKNAVRTAKGWDWERLTQNNFRLFNDLLYYVLIGNSDALSRFNGYMPADVSQSEAMAGLYRKAVEESLLRAEGSRH